MTKLRLLPGSLILTAGAVGSYGFAATASSHATGETPAVVEPLQMQEPFPAACSLADVKAKCCPAYNSCRKSKSQHVCAKQVMNCCAAECGGKCQYTNPC